MGFPGGTAHRFSDVSGGKESACNVGDLGSIPGLGWSPGEGKGYPLQYSRLENPHGQRELLGYSPQDCRVGPYSATKHRTPISGLPKCHLIRRADSLEKDSDAGKDWRWEEKGMTEDKMVGWHHWLSGREFEQVLGDGGRTGKTGVL